MFKIVETIKNCIDSLLRIDSSVFAILIVLNRSGYKKYLDKKKNLDIKNIN